MQKQKLQLVKVKRLLFHNGGSLLVEQLDRMGECHAHKGCCILPLERCQEDLHSTLDRQPSEQTMCQMEILICI